MRRLAKGCVVAVGATMVIGMTAPAIAESGPGNPTGSHTNPSGCIGAERATRNSDGGNREHGGFGPANAEYIASIHSGDTSYANFGEFLAAWKAAYCPTR